MTYIKLKIVATCLNLEDKEVLFEYFQNNGAKIDDHKIDFKTNQLTTWLLIEKECEEKFDRAVIMKRDQFTILSASRGKDSNKKKRKKHGKR